MKEEETEEKRGKLPRIVKEVQFVQVNEGPKEEEEGGDMEDKDWKLPSDVKNGQSVQVNEILK